VGYDLRLLISCSDKKGLISALSSFIAMHDGNILSADQYVSARSQHHRRRYLL
jgi:formyltetrahydrofolate deformylase